MNKIIDITHIITMLSFHISLFLIGGYFWYEIYDTVFNLSAPWQYKILICFLVLGKVICGFILLGILFAAMMNGLEKLNRWRVG